MKNLLILIVLAVLLNGQPSFTIGSTIEQKDRTYRAVDESTIFFELFTRYPVSSK